MPRIPLIDDLTTGVIPAGLNILVEYEPSSQWYAASIAMTAGWLKQGGSVSYNAYAQSPANIRIALKRLGIETAPLEAEQGRHYERLRIWDFYTPTLGLMSAEKFTGPLKVADLSILFSREQFKLKPDPLRLRITDDNSTVARFNDEKSWVEFLLTRAYPFGSIFQSTSVGGLMKGVHSEWVYNRLEAASDAMIDVKVEEYEGEVRNRLRIRTMRNLGFDSRWHTLKINENFELTLE